MKCKQSNKSKYHNKEKYHHEAHSSGISGIRREAEITVTPRLKTNKFTDKVID